MADLAEACLTLTYQVGGERERTVELDQFKTGGKTKRLTWQMPAGPWHIKWEKRTDSLDQRVASELWGGGMGGGGESIEFRTGGTSVANSFQDNPAEIVCR